MHRDFISVLRRSDRSVPVIEMKEAAGQEQTEAEKDKAILKRLKKTNNPRTVSGIKYFRCPVCLKEFSTHLYSGWVYKLHRNSHLLMFCGYTCMRKAESLCEDGRKKYKDGITE